MNFLKKINTNAMIWSLRKVKKRVPALLLLTFLSVINGYLGVVFALGTQGVIDSAIHGELVPLAWAASKLGALILCMILCRVMSRHVNDRLEADMDRDLKKMFMHLILHGDYQQVVQYHSGNLVYRLNADVRIITNTLMNIFPSLASLCVQTVAVIAVLMGISPVFTGALILMCIIVGGAMLLLKRLMKSLNKDIADASGKITGFLQEMAGKLLIVQALDVASIVEEKEEALLESRWQLQRKRKNLGILTSTGLSFVGYIISFTTLVWCAYQMMLGNMTFGMLTATTQLADQLETPIYVLPSLLNQLISMSVSAERLMDLEKIDQTDNTNLVNADAVYSNMREISAEGLCFGYDRSTVLDHVSFTIPKGGITVVTGSSGIGKSTLLKLLLGIYHPTESSIRIRGSGGDTIVSRNTRNLFSFAPQGNLLISGTLRENLTFARPDATEDEITQAVYASCMDEYISQLPEGLDTYLGENAAGLSEGQAQRLSLARAILSRAPILLLDEVTSSLDAQTEQRVLKRIREMQGRTCIAVTHRPAVLELADWQLHITEDHIESKPLSHAGR